MASRDDALDLAQKLADLEAEYDIPMNNPLHQAMRQYLGTYADTLGLTDNDVADIEAVGHQTPAKPGAAQPRDGTGKDPQ